MSIPEFLMSEHELLKHRLAEIRHRLQSIVCTDGVDAGVVLLSQESKSRYDPVLECQVYENEYFSPLGDALIGLYELTDTEEKR